MMESSPTMLASPQGRLATWSIRASVFLAGAAMLVVETAGARLLSPHFGSSLQVWSALIVATMLSLAAGYALGGRAADRWPSPGTLFWTLALSGAALAPPAVEGSRIASALSPWGASWGAFAAALATLGPCLCLLGAATPIASRLRAREPERLGGAFGGVQSIGTWGGLAGALAAGLILLPRLGVCRVLGGVSAALAGFAIINILGLRASFLIVPPIPKE